MPPAQGSASEHEAQPVRRTAAPQRVPRGAFYIARGVGAGAGHRAARLRCSTRPTGRRAGSSSPRSIGFPFWIAFAWFYEFTPEGIEARERDRAARVDHAPHRPQARLRDHRRAGDCRRAAGDRSLRAAPRRRTRKPRSPVAGALDRRAAVREHERRARIERVFLRRHLRRTAEPAREDSAVAGDGAHLVVLVQGQGSRRSRRSRARCTSRTCSKARCASPATRCGSRRS